MINYLKGIVDHLISQNNRSILLLEVNNIGYEIQVPNRWAKELRIDNQQIIQVFTHFLIRDDQQILYGFASAAGCSCSCLIS